MRKFNCPVVDVERPLVSLQVVLPGRRLQGVALCIANAESQPCVEQQHLQHAMALIMPTFNDILHVAMSFSVVLKKYLNRCAIYNVKRTQYLPSYPGDAYNASSITFTHAADS